jgi:hypothetical protein
MNVQVAAVAIAAIGFFTSFFADQLAPYLSAAKRRLRGEPEPSVLRTAPPAEGGIAETRSKVDIETEIELLKHQQTELLRELAQAERTTDKESG